ncbi:hypothetical protein KC19_6G097500 [Ceratodon purpureus]|uniref:Uncharacterized protein n=1 Tax=Ceratodon purpureus TaxID=3225 RepID=A0A8T0HE00_CERPU|nr:hypothetical protein KC19_6G097500 [Ceratodon purpureus]
MALKGRQLRSSTHQAISIPVVINYLKPQTPQLPEKEQNTTTHNQEWQSNRNPIPSNPKPTQKCKRHCGLYTKMMAQLIVHSPAANLTACRIKITFPAPVTTTLAGSNLNLDICTPRKVKRMTPTITPTSHPSILSRRT